MATQADQLTWPDFVEFPLPIQVGKRFVPIAASDVERFLGMTRLEDGCLRFTRGFNPRTGYAVHGLKFQVNVLAHRFAYTVWRGPIPAGLTLDHLCHNEAAIAGLCPGGRCAHRVCVWPWSLMAKTSALNSAASPFHPGGAGENDRNTRGGERMADSTPSPVPPVTGPAACGAAVTSMPGACAPGLAPITTMPSGGTGPSSITPSAPQIGRAQCEEKGESDEEMGV